MQGLFQKLKRMRLKPKPKHVVHSTNPTRLLTPRDRNCQDQGALQMAEELSDDVAAAIEGAL